jgi:hypothetical protein
MDANRSNSDGCAFCGSAGRLTREHLWPASLHARLAAINEDEKNRFWLSRLAKEIEGEPTLRDVCADCNNGTLSSLDAYICELFDRSLFRILQKGEEIEFRYDYHTLKRWLLKMCYNSARIHRSADLKALRILAPYILDPAEAVGESVQLFLQLAYPELVPKVDLRDKREEVVFEPLGHRAGHLLFRVHDIGQKLLRAVHLRSYSFYLAFFRPGESAAVMADFAEVFCTRRVGVRILSAQESACRLACNGIGAWASFRSSRGTKLEFSAPSGL